MPRDFLFVVFSAYAQALSLRFEQTAIIKIPRPSLSRAKVSINSSISASAAAFFLTASARRLDCCSIRVDLQDPRIRTARNVLCNWLPHEAMREQLASWPFAQRDGDGLLPSVASLVTELVDALLGLVQALVETSAALLQLSFSLDFQVLLNTETIT